MKSKDIVVGQKYRTRTGFCLAVERIERIERVDRAGFGPGKEVRIFGTTTAGNLEVSEWRVREGYLPAEVECLWSQERYDREVAEEQARSDRREARRKLQSAAEQLAEALEDLLAFATPLYREHFVGQEPKPSSPEMIAAREALRAAGRL